MQARQYSSTVRASTYWDSAAGQWIACLHMCHRQGDLRWVVDGTRETKKPAIPVSTSQHFIDNRHRSHAVSKALLSSWETRYPQHPTGIEHAGLAPTHQGVIKAAPACSSHRFQQNLVHAPLRMSRDLKSIKIETQRRSSLFSSLISPTHIIVPSQHTHPAMGSVVGVYCGSKRNSDLSAGARTCLSFS